MPPERGTRHAAGHRFIDIVLGHAEGVAHHLRQQGAAGGGIAEHFRIVGPDSGRLDDDSAGGAGRERGAEDRRGGDVE